MRGAWPVVQAESCTTARSWLGPESGKCEEAGGLVEILDEPLQHLDAELAEFRRVVERDAVPGREQPPGEVRVGQLAGEVALGEGAQMRDREREAAGLFRVGDVARRPMLGPPMDRMVRSAPAARPRVGAPAAMAWRIGASQGAAPRTRTASARPTASAGVVSMAPVRLREPSSA